MSQQFTTWFLAAFMLIPCSLTIQALEPVQMPRTPELDKRFSEAMQALSGWLDEEPGEA